MRDELQRVLTCSAMQPWLARTDRDDAAGILAQFDRLSQVHVQVPSGSPRCSDPDDQKFIDLALALQALLLSKDHAVLRLRRALAARAVTVARGFSSAA
jgi:predicted nucleic acid-binding protein